MKTKLTICTALMIGFLTIINVEAGSYKTDLVKNGTVSVEKIYTEKIRVSSVWVYKEKNKIIISGRVSRSPGNRNRRFTMGGHVDIAIINSEGNIIKELTLEHHPKSLRKRSGFFKTTLHEDIITGNTIRVVYHKPSFKKQEKVHCDNNKAIPTA